MVAKDRGAVSRSLLEELRQDLRYGLRGLKRNRGFTFVVLLSLAVGIGANTAIFTLVDATLNRPLPFLEPERLVVVTEENVAKGLAGEGAAPGNLLDWREARDVFSGLAGSYARSVVVSEEEGAEILVGAQVTADFFSVHGVAPTIGRTFLPDEIEMGLGDAAGVASAGPVVISDRLWQRRFGGSAAVLGGTISLDGATRTIVGVMPSSFVAGGAEAELWLPWNPLRAYARLNTVPRDFRFLQAVGRLQRGVTVGEAQRRMETLAAAMAQDYPATNSGWSVAVTPLRAHLVGDTRPTLLALFGAVVLVLALMSANVANLQLARGAVREREMAVRYALGVTRGRLVRQLLTESLMLCVMGGALGVVLSNVDGAIHARACAVVDRRHERSCGGWSDSSFRSRDHAGGECRVGALAGTSDLAHRTYRCFPRQGYSWNAAEAWASALPGRGTSRYFAGAGRRCAAPRPERVRAAGRRPRFLG